MRKTGVSHRIDVYWQCRPRSRAVLARLTSWNTRVLQHFSSPGFAPAGPLGSCKTGKLESWNGAGFVFLRRRYRCLRTALKANVSLQSISVRITFVVATVFSPTNSVAGAVGCACRPSLCVISHTAFTFHSRQEPCLILVQPNKKTLTMILTMLHL